MKFCPNCHLTYDDTANVCGQCGGPLQLIPQQIPQAQPAYDPADHTAEFNPKDISDNKVFAMLPYLMSFIGVIIALLAAPASPYTLFHVRQGLKLAVVQILVTIVGAIIPFLGWIAAGICVIVIVVIEIICFFRVCKGQAKEPPIIQSLSFLK